MMVADRDTDALIEDAPGCPKKIRREIAVDLDAIAASQERTLAVMRELLNLPPLSVLVAADPPAWARWGRERGV